MEEPPTPDVQDSMALDTKPGISLGEKAESNTGIRKSSRPRKQSKRILDSAECEDDELVGVPQHKKRCTSLKVRTHRRKDILQNGRPFRCSLCQSQYINNSPAKAKVKREVQPIVKERCGQLLQLCVKCATAVNHTENKGPTPEQRAEFEEEGKQFAQHLVKYLSDSAAARLYCSFYQTTKCGCIQGFITGTQANRRRKTSVLGADPETSDSAELKGDDGVASTDDKAHQTERARFLLGLLKESMAKKQAQNTKTSNDKSQQTRSDNTSAMKESEKFILENRVKLKELGICERGCQKVLCYSNNFLHKKSFGSQPRLQRTKGRAALGRLQALDDLCKMRCCEKNCVKLAGKNQAKLASWRQRAQGGQKEMWKVLEEMVTYTVSDGGKTCCYKFICMVTGCCLTTVQKVYAEVLLSRGTTGCPSQKEHGMIVHWKRQKQQGQLLKVQAMAAVQGQTLKTESLMCSSPAVRDTSFIPTSVADRSESSQAPDMKKEQKVSAVVTHMAASSQVKTEPQLRVRVADGREEKQHFKEKFLQLFENIKDPQEIANMQVILAEFQKNLMVKQEMEHAQRMFPSVPSSGTAATVEPSFSARLSSSTPLAPVPAISQTLSCLRAASGEFSQTVQESHLTPLSVCKTGRPFVHIKVPQTVPEQKTLMYDISQAGGKEPAAVSDTRSHHTLHMVQNATSSAKDFQVVDDLYSAPVVTPSSQHLTQQTILSRVTSEPGHVSAQPRTSMPAVSSGVSGSSTTKTPNVTVSSENSFSDLAGLFQVVASSQTETSQKASGPSQMLSVYPQQSLQIQPLSLPSCSSAQNVQFQLFSPLIIGQPNLMIPFNPSGTTSFILQKAASDGGSQGSQSFLQAAAPPTSSSSTAHKDFVVSHVSPMQNFPPSAQSPSDSRGILSNRCLSTFPSQTECSLTFSNNTYNIQYSMSGEMPASKSGVREHREAAIQNLQNPLGGFSESAEPHGDISHQNQTNKTSMTQNDSSPNSATTAVVHFPVVQTGGQERELIHQVSKMEQYFPSALLTQAAGSSLFGTASSCSSSSFVFDALAESPVKDSSLPLASPALQSRPIVTSSLLCEMLLSSDLSLATTTASQTPGYAVNSRSSPLSTTTVPLTPGYTSNSLSAISMKPSSSTSAYCQSINFSTHTTPSPLSTQPVVMASKVEQTSLPIAVTIGHNASLSHSKISVSRLNRQRDPPQVGIVHPHVSGGKGSLGDLVNSHACSSTFSPSQNSVYSSSVTSAALNVLGETQSVSTSGSMPVNNANIQVAGSGQELSRDVLSNQRHPQQQQLLLSLLLSSQNANLPDKTINIPQTSQFNLSALLGSPGNSSSIASSTNDSHKRETNSGSQNDINTYNFHVSSQNVPNPHLQNTVIDSGNFLQNQTPFLVRNLMPASIGNQNTVSGNSSSQVPICDPHMIYSNAGHVKLVPVILSDGSPGSAPNLFSQNGQLLLNMSPCAGLGSVSSISSQSLNRDGTILLNLSPSSGQNIQLQHPALQLEDIAQTTSGFPLASPNSQNIDHSGEAASLSKDQTQTVQVSVLPWTTQQAERQLLAQAEFQRDGLSQSIPNKESVCENNVENKMSFNTFPGLFRKTAEAAPTQKSHSDLSSGQFILSSTNAVHNACGQDIQSNENSGATPNALISCNLIQAGRSSENPHKITDVARTVSANVPTSGATETQSPGFTNTAMSEPDNLPRDPTRESRSKLQVYLLNQRKNRPEDQQSHLESTHLAAQQFHPNQFAVQQRNSTHLAVQQLQPTQLVAQQLQSTQLAAQQLQPTQLAPQQPQPTQLAPQQPQPTQLAPQQPQPTQLAAQQPQPTHLAAQQPQPTHLAAQQLQLPLQVVSVVHSPAEQTNSDRLMASNVGTNFVLGQPAFQNFGLGHQLHSFLSLSNGNQIFLPVQSVPFSSNSTPEDNVSQSNLELQLGQQLSELHKTSAVKSIDGSCSLVLPAQVTRSGSTHITSMQSAVTSSGSHQANSVTSNVSSCKHRPIRPKLRPIPAPSSKILMLVPDKPGYPSYQLTQVDSAALPFQPASEEGIQSQLVSQQPPNSVLNHGTSQSLQQQNSLPNTGLAKQKNATIPLANTAFVTQLPMNQQQNMPTQILLLSQSDVAQRLPDSEKQTNIRQQNDVLTLPSEQTSMDIHGSSLGGNGTTNKSKDILEVISQPVVSINLGSSQMTPDYGSALSLLQNETVKFSSTDGADFRLKSFENKEFRTGIFNNESIFVNTSQGIFSSDTSCRDTLMKVSSLPRGGIDLGPQQHNAVEFTSLEANAAGYTTPQSTLSQSLMSSQVIPTQQVVLTDIQRLNPLIVSQLGSGDTQRLNSQVISQIGSGNTQRLNSQICSQLLSGDTQGLNSQIVSQLSSGDTQRLNSQMISQLSDGDMQILKSQIVSQHVSGDANRLNLQFINDDTQILEHHNPSLGSSANGLGDLIANGYRGSQTMHASSADGLGDLITNSYRGSHILGFTHPESHHHHHSIRHPDGKLDPPTSSSAAPHISSFTHSDHSPAGVTAQPEEDNRGSQVALGGEHGVCSAYSNVQIHGVKTSRGSQVALGGEHGVCSTYSNVQIHGVKTSCVPHFNTAVKKQPVPSSELPLYTQFPQKQMQQTGSMPDVQLTKGADTKPAPDPIQYLQCKEVIDLTEQDSPPLSPNSISVTKGKTLSLVSVLGGQAQKYIFYDSHLPSQQHTVNVPVQGLLQQTNPKESLCLQQEWGQLDQESKEGHGALHDRILPEGTEFPLCSGSKKELTAGVLKLEQIPEDLRQMLLAALESHVVPGSSDVHLVAKTIAPSEDLSNYSFLSLRDQNHSVTDAADRNGCSSNEKMIDSNPHIERQPARAHSQIPLSATVSESKLGAMIHIQPPNKKLCQPRRPGVSNPSPGLSSSATKLTGQLKQDMGSAFPGLKSAVSATSCLSSDASAIPSSHQTSSHVVSPGSHKPAGTATCPPLLLASLNTILPRSPNVKAPLNRSGIPPLASSTVTFIRTNNTPTEAVGPPNITIMSSAQANTSPHLRLRHENNVSNSAAVSNPLIISDISSKPVSAVAKNHSSILLKINSNASAAVREQCSQDGKLSDMLHSASEGKDKLSSQSDRRLSFENNFPINSEKEAAVIKALSPGLPVRSLLKPPEVVTPSRLKGRKKKASTIMDLLKNKERLQASASALASSGFSVNSNTGPIAFVIPGTPDILLMESAATRAGINSGTMNVAVKNLHLTRMEDADLAPKQLHSSSQGSGLAILQPNILPSLSGGCNFVVTSSHILAETAAEQTSLAAAALASSTSQARSQVGISLSDSRPQETEKAIIAAPGGSSLTGSLFQAKKLSGVLAQSPAISSEFSASFYTTRNLGTEISGYSDVEKTSTNNSGAVTKDSNFKSTHLQVVPKSDLQPVGQPQVASGSFNLKDPTPKPHAQPFGGDKLKFKTTTIKNIISVDRPQELINNTFRLLEDTPTNLAQNTGTVKKLLLLNEKSVGYNSKLLSDSLLRSNTQISDQSQQDWTNEKQMPQKSPQLLQLMKSKQSVPYAGLEPAVNAKLAHTSGHDKGMPLKLASSGVNVTASGENLVYDYSASAHLSYHQNKEDPRQKDQLHVFKQESSNPALPPKGNNLELMETNDCVSNLSVLETNSDPRINFLPSQHPLLAGILFPGDGNSTLLKTLPADCFDKSTVHFENHPVFSGRKRGNTEGDVYSNDHIVLGHQLPKSHSDHLQGSKGEKHSQLGFEGEDTASGFRNHTSRAPPAYGHTPRYEIPKKDMTRVNRVIEDIYRFPDEGEEPSPPPVFGGLKLHKFTYTLGSQERAAGLSGADVSEPVENTQFSVVSDKKSSPKTVQNNSGDSAAASPARSHISSHVSGNTAQTWRSPKKLKTKIDPERSNCKMNLKKVQFSDIVTSKSAPKYSQSTAVNCSVSTPKAVSSQWEETKCLLQESPCEDGQKLLAKYERLDKEKQDCHIVYEKHAYTGEQLETQFQDGKVRTYTALSEAAFIRTENIQVNIKPKASKTLGFNSVQRETDPATDFENERHFAREIHKVFQPQNLAGVSHPAADGEQKFQHKDTSQFQTLRQAHENPCEFQSGFVQENVDTVYSYVNDRTETSRLHSVQNAAKSREQTVMPGTFEAMSSQSNEMIHKKVEEGSRDAAKRRHMIHDVSTDPDNQVHVFEKNNYDLPPTNMVTSYCDRDSVFDQQSSFNILSTQGYSKLSRQRLHRADPGHIWAEDLTLASHKPHGIKISEPVGTSDHYENRDFSHQIRCDPLPASSESSSNAERPSSDSPLSRQKILESNFEIARQMKKGHVRILKDSRSELSEGRTMESPQKFFLHPERSQDLSSQMQRDAECQIGKELEYSTSSGPSSKLTSPIFSNNMDGRPDVLTSLESLSCLRKEIKDLKGENHYLKLEVARAEQKGKEQQRQRKLSTNDKRALSTEIDKVEKNYCSSSTGMGSQLNTAETDNITPIRKWHSASTTALGALNYTLFPGSEHLKLEEGFQSKVCQLSSGSSGTQQMFDPDIPFPEGSHRVTAAEAVYSRSSINIDDSPEHYIRDTRDPLVSSSMSSHSRPASQLDLSMAHYEIARYKYPFSEGKSAPLRSTSDGDGFAPLQEHTRHRNLSSSLGFHVLSDADPPPYDITQRQRNPSASSLKSAFQDTDILNFDIGVRSRNPSSSSWARYLDYGTDFALIRSRNPSGSSNRRSRPGSSSSSEREHPVNVDELPPFPDFAPSRSRNSSGESIEPTLDHIIDPQQFMQYTTQYTYLPAEAHSKRPKH